VEYNRNPYDLNPAITVKEVFEKWTDNYFQTLKTEASVLAVKKAWTYCKEVYDMRVMDIRARHVKGCMDSIESANIKGKIKSLFNLMLDYALEYELVDRNYSRSFNMSEELVKDIQSVKNSHEPIIEKDVFELAQKLRDGRRRKPSKRTGECSPLSGLVWCSDCGSRLSLARQGDIKYTYYICSKYRNSEKHYKAACSRHGIRRDILEDLVLDKIREVWQYATRNKADFAEKVRRRSSKESAKAIKSKTAALDKADRRISELDIIIQKSYEDNALGKLSDERFAVKKIGNRTK